MYVMLNPGRGRDTRYRVPPAQIPACAIHAPGSCLGCLAVNRSTGHGCRTRTFGSHTAASLFAFVHVVSSCWLLRLSVMPSAINAIKKAR